ncbi:NifU family protein [Streptomyces orinoci]|uniref:NifU family protein n=1 Tax=Streptomyces orinoci TaxID=67339 RepID=A0ABV3K814_STRON|nr:NifU family protein [Streptomyces orinoci]
MADRLDDQDIGRRLARVDDLLERVEGAPGPTAGAALEAVRLLTEVYGEALARVLDAAGPSLGGRLAEDELIGHLLVLHGLHPDGVERRVTRALDGLRPALREHGGEVELAGVAEGVATVRLTAEGCRSTAAALEQAVREAVLAIAPELSEVRRLPDAAGPPAFVPLSALARPAAATGGPG